MCDWLKPVGFDQGGHIPWALPCLSWQEQMQALPVHFRSRKKTAEF